MAAGTEFCQNLGLMTADPSFNVEVKEFVLESGETLTGFSVIESYTNNSYAKYFNYLNQIKVITSNVRTVELGNGFGSRSHGGISSFGMGSGVLDGLVFTMGPLGKGTAPPPASEAIVLTGIAPIMLQPYNSLLLKVDKLGNDVPADLPSRVNTYNLNVSMDGVGGSRVLEACMILFQYLVVYSVNSCLNPSQCECL